jgi:hypothetical protein
MCKNDRKRIRTLPALVNEMEADIVHLGSEMSESVKGGFVLPPVVGVMPVADQFPEVIAIGAHGPPCVLPFDKKTVCFLAAREGRLTLPEQLRF